MASATGSTSISTDRATGMGCVIDRAARSVLVDGVAIRLTAMEFNIAAYLSAHPGVHRSRVEIMDACGVGEVYEDAVKSHIKRIRRKGVAEICTSYGFGYFWEGHTRIETRELLAIRAAEEVCRNLGDQLLCVIGHRALEIAALIPDSLLGAVSLAPFHDRAAE